MHNIDRTNLESNYGEYAGEFEADELGNEYEGDLEAETYGEYLGEYQEFEGEDEYAGEYAQEGPFSEVEEMELAAELLTVSNEAELDQFFGGLLKKIGKGLGKAIKIPEVRALGGILKQVAKKALPAIGGAAGNFILPGVGGIVGSKLASTAGGMLGLELEGLSYEDQEFEVAKQLVRLTGAAAEHAAQAAPGQSPQQVVQAALTSAAEQYAPGLLRPATNQTGLVRKPSPNGCGHKTTGRWIRRGNAIIILGA